MEYKNMNVIIPKVFVTFHRLVNRTSCSAKKGVTEKRYLVVNCHELEFKYISKQCRYGCVL